MVRIKHNLEIINVFHVLSKYTSKRIFVGIRMLLDTGLFEDILVVCNYAIGISQQAIEHSLFGKDGNAGPIYVPLFTFVVLVINISLLYLDVKHKKMELAKQQKQSVVNQTIEGIYTIIVFDGINYIYVQCAKPKIDSNDLELIKQQFEKFIASDQTPIEHNRLLPWWEVVFFLPLAVWRADRSWKIIILMGLVFYGCSIGITQVNYNTVYYDLTLYGLQYSLICALYGLIYKIEMRFQIIYWWQIMFWPWASVILTQWYTYAVVRHFYRHKMYKDKKILLRK